MPALFDLYRKGILPKNMRIIGFSRRDIDEKQFREMVKGNRGDRSKRGDWERFRRFLSYIRGDFTKIVGFEELNKILGRQDNEWKFCANKLFYLAVPPRYYEVIIDHLDAAGLTKPCGPDEGWTRVILEKPFGKDLATAQALDEKLGKLFREEQIFRIDHFLGKEPLLNILAFRFGNAIFEPIWNRKYIDHVQINFTETLGIEERGAFYDEIGALRDVVQSHLLQATAVTAMERPINFAVEAIRDERVRVLKALRCYTADKVGKMTVRGQYEGYRKEKGVKEDSDTETYTALKFFIDTDRWSEVPFYLQTGKKFKEDLFNIVVQFREVPEHLFIDNHPRPNRIIFKMKPERKISIEVLMKEPGLEMRLSPHLLEVDYGKVHGHEFLSAYEKLLVDAMVGEQTLYARTDGIGASWQFVMPLLEAWQKSRAKLEQYKLRSLGPEGAKKLIERDGRRWYLT